MLVLNIEYITEDKGLKIDTLLFFKKVHIYMEKCFWVVVREKLWTNSFRGGSFEDIPT
jgi:hypothetical protein